MSPPIILLILWTLKLQSMDKAWIVKILALGMLMYTKQNLKIVSSELAICTIEDTVYIVDCNPNPWTMVGKY